ncbi:hypothetical protein D9M72_374770 [compost metagenome]
MLALHVFACAQHLHLRPVELRGDLRARHDQCATAVGHDAAVHAAQRVGDHWRTDHIVHRQHLAQHGVRVVLRVVRGRHLDPRKLLGCGAELMHVAHRDHRVVVDGHGAERQFKGQVWLVDVPGARRGAGQAFRAGAAGQGDERHVALAHGDGLRGVRDVSQIGRAAGLRRVDMADLQAEIVDHVHGAEAGGVARAEIAVDLGQRQPGVFQRTLGAFGVELCHGLVGRLAGRMLVGPDDICLASDAHACFLLVKNGWERYERFGAALVPLAAPMQRP